MWTDSEFLPDTAARLQPSAGPGASRNMALALPPQSPRRMAPAAVRRVTSAQLETAAPNMATGTFNNAVQELHGNLTSPASGPSDAFCGNGCQKNYGACK